jgi:hypothetical protein
MSSPPNPDLDALLEAADDHVAAELKVTPEVVSVGHDLDLDKVSIRARRWLKVEDAVVVAIDLKNSTQLGLNKWAASTASIYEAAIRPLIDTLVRRRRHRHPGRRRLRHLLGRQAHRARPLRRHHRKDLFGQAPRASP